METVAPWLVLLAFSALTWWATPRRVNAAQFFDGRTDNGRPPGVLMVAMGAAITWVFAQSIANASDLAYGYGLTGGIGYALYYLSFVVAGLAERGAGCGTETGLDWAGGDGRGGGRR